MLNGTVFGGGVILGNHDHGGRQRETYQGAEPHAHGFVAHDGLGDEIKRNGGNDAGDDDAFVQGIHDLAAFLGGHEERADDGRNDGNGAQDQREQHRSFAHVDHDESAQQHGGDEGDGVGLEQVGGHAGAIAHVVADVVGDDRRIARIILRYSCLDLADEVRPNVCALGEDSTAQAREYGDQRAAECQTDQRPQRRFGVAQNTQHEEEVAGHAQQP